MATLTAAILTGQLSTLFQAWDAQATIIPRRVLGIDEDGFDRDFLRSAGAGDRIRAAAFWVSGIDTSTTPALRTGMPVLPARKCEQVWTIQVRLFREFQTGSDLSNAELDFLEWVASLGRYLGGRPFLGLEGYQVGTHEDVQFPSPRVDMIGSGESLIFQAAGTLRIPAYFTV